MPKRTKVLVGGVEMIVCDSSNGTAKVGDDTPHSHYAVRRTDVHAELTAVRDIATKIGIIDSVVEVFGGSGWHSSIIQRLCSPVRHIAYDISQDCVDSIRLSLPNVAAVCTDSYKAPMPVSNWVHCDFNNLTYKRYINSEAIRQLVERAALSSTGWLTITDSALFGLIRFEKNRRSYDEHLPKHVNGVSASNMEPYYYIWWSLMMDLGFRLVDIRSWRSMAAMMLFHRFCAPDFAGPGTWAEPLPHRMPLNKVEPSITVEVVT